MGHGSSLKHMFLKDDVLSMSLEVPPPSGALVLEVRGWGLWGWGLWSGGPGTGGWLGRKLKSSLLVLQA